MRSCLEPNAVLGIILVLKQWGKFLFPSSIRGSQLLTKDGRWSAGIVFSPIDFFWLLLSKTSPFRERSSPQTQHNPRWMHQLMPWQILLEFKPSQLAFLPQIQTRGMIPQLIPKLQIINFQLSSMTKVLQAPVGVYGIKGAAFLPAQAQIPSLPGGMDGHVVPPKKKPFYSQRTGNKGK